jgi:predicted histone-like DNA-binding protein
MAIPYHVIQRGEPGVKGGGKKQYYARPVVAGETDIASLTRSIEKISTVSGADVQAVLYALVDVMADELAQGRIVRLGELGSMRVSFKSEGKPAVTDINATDISNPRTLFTPGPRIKSMLKGLSFTKA